MSRGGPEQPRAPLGLGAPRGEGALGLVLRDRAPSSSDPGACEGRQVAVWGGALCLSPRDAARQAERVEERAGACVLGAPLLPSPGPGGAGGAGCPVAGRHLLGSLAATTRRHHGNVSALLHAASGGTPPGSLFWGQERDQGTPDPNELGSGSAGRPDAGGGRGGLGVPEGEGCARPWLPGGLGQRGFMFPTRGGSERWVHYEPLLLFLRLSVAVTPQVADDAPSLVPQRGQP